MKDGVLRTPRMVLINDKKQWYTRYDRNIIVYYESLTIRKANLPQFKRCLPTQKILAADVPGLPKLNRFT
jgi:hypothetical protein